MNDTLSKRLEADQEHYRIMRLVNVLYHNILRDYIAPTNERDVLENLYKFYTDSDITLINKNQLKVYQELEKHQLNISMLQVNKNG